MHKIILFLVLFLSLKGCSQTNSANQLKSLIYTASSRGFFLKVSADENEITVIKERDGIPQKKAINEQEWKHFVEQANTLTKKDKAPKSERSKVDAAIPVKLKILMGNTEHLYEFDRDDPPEHLKNLVNALLSLSDKV